MKNTGNPFYFGELDSVFPGLVMDGEEQINDYDDNKSNNVLQYETKQTSSV